MRRLVASIPLALVLSALSASSALAGAPKGPQEPLYDNIGDACEIGGVENGAPYGSVVWSTSGNGNSVAADVTLTSVFEANVTPVRTLPVRIVQVVPSVGCTFSAVGEIKTKKSGMGRGHFTAKRVQGATKFWVAIEDFVVGTEYTSPAVELN
jgi:hypothetical protein